MTGATTRRRRSPPPLLRSSSSFAAAVPLSLSSSASSSSARIQIQIQSDPGPGKYYYYRRSTKCIGPIVGLVLFAWLRLSIVVLSANRDEPSSSDHRGRFPIMPMSGIGVRGSNNSTIISHDPKHEKWPIATKLPKHYFQLQPSTATTTTTTTTNKDPAARPPWSWPVIHVVTTRFMQGQGNLVDLARSRLKLLEAICLPSLMKQTIFDDATLATVYEHTQWEDEVKQQIIGKNGNNNNNNNYNNNSHERVVTDPRFLWIIKVDPDLDATVLEELKDVLEPVEEFALAVGSNTNYGIGIKPGGWRDGQAGRDVLDAYDNGHGYFPEEGSDDDDDDDAYRMLRRAHGAREHRVVIETRLDADDAINVEYVAELQYSALRQLVDHPRVGIGQFHDDNDGNSEDGENNEELTTQTARWLYWCPRTHLQWNPSSSGADDGNPGMLQMFRMPQTCVTAGLSLGVAVGTKEENVPRYEHAKLYWQIAVNHNNEGLLRNGTVQQDNNNNEEEEMTTMIDKHDCGLYPSSRCAVLVDEPKISAFRSRAMTSAGMHNIEAGGAPTVETPEEYRDVAAGLWNRIVEDQFGIKPEKAKEAADFMMANYLGTVRDNLRGQCTRGHSCKISSLEKLQRTIDILEEGTGGVELSQK